MYYVYINPSLQAKHHAAYCFRLSSFFFSLNNDTFARGAGAGRSTLSTATSRKLATTPAAAPGPGIEKWPSVPLDVWPTSRLNYCYTNKGCWFVFVLEHLQQNQPSFKLGDLSVWNSCGLGLHKGSSYPIKRDANQCQMKCNKSLEHSSFGKQSSHYDVSRTSFRTNKNFERC